MAEYILALEDDLKNQVNYCAFSSNCLNLTLLFLVVLFFSIFQLSRQFYLHWMRYVSQGLLVLSRKAVSTYVLKISFWLWHSKDGERAEREFSDFVVVRRRPPAILYLLLFNLYGQTSHMQLFSYSSMLNPLDSRNFTMVEALIG
jgi:hypothetical protein